MDHTDIPPFYVGQEVIAITNSDHWKKGDEFIVMSCKKSDCLCKIWVIDIGVRCVTTRMHCAKCRIYYPADYHFDACCFTPKLEFSDLISMKEITEKALELTSAN